MAFLGHMSEVADVRDVIRVWNYGTNITEHILAIYHKTALSAPFI